MNLCMQKRWSENEINVPRTTHWVYPLRWNLVNKRGHLCTFVWSIFNQFSWLSSWIKVMQACQPEKYVSSKRRDTHKMICNTFSNYNYKTLIFRLLYCLWETLENYSKHFLPIAFILVFDEIFWTIHCLIQSRQMPNKREIQCVEHEYEEGTKHFYIDNCQ